MSVTVTFEIPDDLAALLVRDGRSLSRAALEALAVEEYRAGRLSGQLFRRMLAIDRFEADGILKAHGVFLDCTVVDFEREGDNIEAAAAVGFASLDRGEFVPHEDVGARVRRLTEK